MKHSLKWTTRCSAATGDGWRPSAEVKARSRFGISPRIRGPLKTWRLWRNCSRARRSTKWEVSLRSSQPSVAESLWQSLQGRYPRDFSANNDSETAARVQEALERLRALRPEFGSSKCRSRDRPGSLGVECAVKNLDGPLAGSGRRPVSRDPTRTPPFRAAALRGVCQMKQERWSEAQADFDKAIELEPGKRDQLEPAGTLFGSVTARTEALESLSKAIELRPASPGFWEDRGRWHAARGPDGRCLWRILPGSGTDLRPHSRRDARIPLLSDHCQNGLRGRNRRTSI